MKTVFITGASGNLGKATVKRFADEGYTIVATTGSGNQALSARSITWVKVNLADEKETESAIENIPTVDAALLLAGGFSMGNLEETSLEDIKKMMSINFDTAFNAVRVLVKKMTGQKNGGKIILVGSESGMNSSKGTNSVAYTLAKSLVFRLAEIVNETGDGKVVAHVVVPGIIDTPSNREAMPGADFTKWTSPEKIADTLAYLCSASAASIRGSILKV